MQNTLDSNFYQQLTDEPFKQYFCYLYIKQFPQTYIGFVFFIINLLIIIQAGRQFYHAKQISVMNKIVKLIYISIFAWGTLFIIEIVFSQILFWWQAYQYEDPQIYSTYSRASEVVFGIDISAAFLVQTVLILVPYNWMNATIEVFQQLSNLEVVKQEGPQIQQNKNYLKFEMISVRLLRFYLIARIFFFFGLIIPFIISTQTYFENTIYYQSMMILLLLEATFVLCILTLGALAVKKNKKLAEIVDQCQIDTMLNQYVILIICAATRLIIDTIFVVNNFMILDCQKTCYIKQESKMQQVFRVINIIVEGLFTHYVPIFIILRIFKVELKSIDLSQSLLAGQTITQSVTK